MTAASLEDIELVLDEVWEIGGRERRAGQAIVELVAVVFAIRRRAEAIASRCDADARAEPKYPEADPI